MWPDKGPKNSRNTYVLQLDPAIAFVGPAGSLLLFVLRRYKALSNWEIVARNAARWDFLLPCFLDSALCNYFFDVP